MVLVSEKDGRSPESFSRIIYLVGRRQSGYPCRMICAMMQYVIWPISKLDIFPWTLWTRLVLSLKVFFHYNLLLVFCIKFWSNCFWFYHLIYITSFSFVANYYKFSKNFPTKLKENCMNDCSLVVSYSIFNTFCNNWIISLRHWRHTCMLWWR